MTKHHTTNVLLALVKYLYPDQPAVLRGARKCILRLVKDDQQVLTFLSSGYLLLRDILSAPSITEPDQQDCREMVEQVFGGPAPWGP
jgi:hypothetical protein